MAESKNNEVRVVSCEDWAMFTKEVKKTRVLNTCGRKRPLGGRTASYWCGCASGPVS